MVVLPDTSDTDKMASFLGSIWYNKDTGVFVRKTRAWNSPEGRILGSIDKKSGYVRLKNGNEKHLAHRIAWLISYGQWPLGPIDHINGIRSDNRLCNLRDVSAAINSQNKRKALKNNKTGFLGVFFQKANGKFCAQIKINNRSIHLGYFDTPEQAHDTYIKAKREKHEGCTL